MAFFSSVGFYPAVNNMELLHTGRHYTDLGIISDLFASTSAVFSSHALSDWKAPCQHLDLLTHEYQWGNCELIIIVLRVVGRSEKHLKCSLCDLICFKSTYVILVLFEYVLIFN